MGKVGTKRPVFKKKMLKILGMIFISLCMIGILFMTYIVFNAEEFEVDKLYRYDATIIYDVNGNVVKKLIYDE